MTLEPTTNSWTIEDHSRVSTNTEPTDDNLTKCLAQGAQLTMTALIHVLDYVLNPGVILIRIVSGVLFYRLSRRGVDHSVLLKAASLLEIVAFILWHLLPNSLSAVVSLYGSFYVYRKLFDKKITVNDNAQIITGKII